MAYYSYHNKAKRLIKDQHLIHYDFYERWNQIQNAYVLFFDNHPPIPIRDYAWWMYQDLLKDFVSPNGN